MMRRKDREIGEFSKMIEILKACDCCRLGLVDGDEAYIVPMNFGYDIIDEQLVLYFHCAKEGRKMDLLPEQRVVAFEMDTKHKLIAGEIGCDFSFMYQCIMGTGVLYAVTDEDEKIRGLQRIMNHYAETKNWEFKSEYVDKVQVLKLNVEAWSCKEH